MKNEAHINKYYNKDTLLLLSDIEDNSIDLIIADPPYYKVKGEFDFEFKNEKEYLEWIKKFLFEFNRVLKDDGTLMLWGGVGKGKTTFCRIAIMIEDNQLFHIQNWITQRNSRGYGTKRNYMSAREEVLFLTKSKKEYTFNIPYTEEKSKRKDLGANGQPRKNKFKRVSNVWSDIAEASQSSIERCFHPTVKAFKLCNRIIETHSNENDVILIPFAGSGSEIICAINKNRKFISSEVNKEYYEKSKERIEKFTKKKL